MYCWNACIDPGSRIDDVCVSDAEHASAVIRSRGCSIAVGGDMTIVRVSSGRSRSSSSSEQGFFHGWVCMGGLRRCLLQKRCSCGLLAWGSDRISTDGSDFVKLRSGNKASSRTGKNGAYTIREEEEEIQRYQRGSHEHMLSGFCFGSSHATTREYPSAIVATPRNLRSLQLQAVCRG